MIRIFNKSKGHEIFIDETHELIFFEPRHYEDLPYVKISFNNIDWFSHKEKCEDCKSLYEDFGTSTYDWQIEYLNIRARLDLGNFGPNIEDNTMSRTFSDFFNGTILKLNLDCDKIEELEILLKAYEIIENDINCCFFRDKINIIKQN